MSRQLLKYSRPDSVPLSGTLYLPPDYAKGTRLPLLIWAYPLEYSDPATAGQVRSSPHAFTFFRGTTPLFFVTQGYAVLMDATMPVVGDPETMNNTFVDCFVIEGEGYATTERGFRVQLGLKRWMAPERVRRPIASEQFRKVQGRIGPAPVLFRKPKPPGGRSGILTNERIELVSFRQA